jgi:monoterpene epsilon-lactone hydrolase
MASRELQLVIQLCRSSRRKRRPTVIELGRLAELRAEYDEIAARNPLPSDINSWPADEGCINAEWLSTSDAEDSCAVLYLHGGCYTSGSVETHRDLMTRLAAETSMRVLGLNYRLAPMHPFPAAVEDASATYRWMLRIGLEPHRIAIGGDSAGAGLALATIIAIRDEGLPVPGAIVCLSPWVDLALTGGSMESKAQQDPIVSREMLSGWGRLYLGERDPATPLASPLYADLHQLPPMLIQVGSAEVLLDDSTRLAERATAGGVDTTLEVWPEMLHVWQTFAPILPEARQAIERIGKFVRKHVGE